MSGLFLAHRLHEAGYDFVVYEKNSDAGGTWHENTYPGLHVDVITRRYEFPFARESRWSKRYAPGSEVGVYLKAFARRPGIADAIHYGTEVTDARYTDGRWRLTLNGGETVTADAVVSATGFLRVPRIPEVPGRDTFTGPAFHSARWDHGVELRG